MDLIQTQKQKKHEAHKFYQYSIIESGAFKCCLNCEHWDDQCRKYNAVPPPEVIVYGCEEWQLDIPF